VTPSALLTDLTQRSETLSERLARLAGGAVELPAARGGNQREKRLRKLLAPWSKVFARGSFEALCRRLAWDGWEPEQAAAAFLPAAALPAPAAAPWTAELERYVDGAQAFAAELDGVKSALLDRFRARREDTPFLELWIPWVAAAAARVAAHEAVCAELSPPALAELESHLLAEIATLSELAAYELYDARRRTAGGRGCYRDFVRDCLGDPLTRLYQPFPVLARQTAESVRQWRERVIELARRLAADRPRIAAAFGAGRPPGAVRSVVAGISDRHRGGRQVLVLELDSGLRLVYKPRSVDLELALGRWFDGCAEHGFELPLRAPRVLRGEGYGWEELVVQERLESREQAGEYYRRAGALAAFAYVLRARDLHAENLVATREGPVIVDAEMFLQPVRARISTDAGPQAAARQRDSCLDSGLLTLTERGPGGGDRELGGLRSEPRRRSSRSRRRWRNLHRDEITVEPGELWSEPRQNALRVGDAPAPPEEFRDQIADGFARAYRFLIAERQALVAAGGPLRFFRGTNVRVLFRRSQDYWTALALMALPRHQRSGLSGSLVCEALLAIFADQEAEPVLWPLAGDERAALAARDVPYFTVPATGTVLRPAAGEEVTGYFVESGLAAVRTRLAGLDETDLAHQLALLGRALEPPQRLAFLAPARAPQELASRCRTLAPALGEELLTRLSKAPLPEAAWNLGGGRLGIALFFAALAHCRGEARYGEAAAALVEPLRRPPEEAGIGGFSGLGGVVYGLSWLGRLLEAEELVARAREAALWIDGERVRADRSFDLEGGAGGAILGLLALAETTGEEALVARAGVCGEHLLAHQELVSSAGAAWRNAGGVALAGWAHGAAGIARALAALAEASAEDRYRIAAAAALGYERTLFDPKRGNWPVLAPDAGSGPPLRSWMTAWCHGAPGIALSRLLLPAIFADAVLEAELAAALGTTAAAPPARLDHLCCGTLGRSAVLLSAGQRLGSDERLAEARRLAALTLERASAEGGFRLRSDPVENREPDPGFLKGLDGIGYHLLRLAGAAELPDVLALELPSECRCRVEGLA